MKPTTVTTRDPQCCPRCAGSGLVEVYVFGVREIRCTGVDDSGNCDDGIVR